MRQKIDIERLYSDAREQLEGEVYDEVTAPAWPDSCPFTLDDLLMEKRAVLEERLRGRGL